MYKPAGYPRVYSNRASDEDWRQVAKGYGNRAEFFMDLEPSSIHDQLASFGVIEDYQLHFKRVNVILKFAKRVPGMRIGEICWCKKRGRMFEKGGCRI